MLVIGVSMILPLLWMVSTSLKPSREILTKVPQFIPSSFVFDNYRKAMEAFPFLNYYCNSLFVAGVVTASTVLLSSLAGFAFAKYKFIGRNVLFVGILSTLMIPFQVIMIPLYIMMSNVGWVDTYPGLMFPRLVNVFGVFLMRQFMINIPEELLSAARIDGCSEWRIFWGIIMPLSKPALATLAIFVFMWSWDEFLWPVIILNSPSKFTVPLGLASFFGVQLGLVKINQLMAAATIATVPVLIVFLAMQKHFIRGITVTGMKG